MFSDYEQQTHDLIIIIYEKSVFCYNQTIYDDMRLEVSEYLGLTLAVYDTTVSTYIPPRYSQVAIQILDNDSKQLITQKSNTLLIMNQEHLVNFEHFNDRQCSMYKPYFPQWLWWVWKGHYTTRRRMWFWLKCVLLCTAPTFPVPLNFPSVLTYQLLMALQVNIVMNTISTYSVFRMKFTFTSGKQC